MGQKGQTLHTYLCAEVELTDGAPSAEFDYSAMGIPTCDGLTVDTGEAPDAFNPIVTDSTQTAGHCSQLKVEVKADTAGPVVHNRDKKGIVTAIPTPNAGETIKVRVWVYYNHSILGTHVDFDA